MLLFYSKITLYLLRLKLELINSILIHNVIITIILIITIIIIIIIEIIIFLIRIIVSADVVRPLRVIPYAA
jgi:hypothetical protein